MEPRSFHPTRVDLCLQRVIDECFARHIDERPNPVIANFVRVHLASIVELSLPPNRLDHDILHDPVGSMLGVSQAIGHRERVQRLTHIGVNILSDFSWRMTDPELPEIRSHRAVVPEVYRLAANDAGNFDLIFQEVCWTVSEHFVSYGQIIGCSARAIKTVLPPEA